MAKPIPVDVEENNRDRSTLSVNPDDRKNTNFVVIVMKELSHTIHSPMHEIAYEGVDIVFCYSGDNWEELIPAATEALEVARSVKVVQYDDIESLLESGVIPEDLKKKVDNASELAVNLTSSGDLFHSLSYTQKPFHITQDFINGVLHYGLNLDGKVHILSSNKEVKNLQECEIEGFEPISENANTFQLSQRGVTSYLFNIGVDQNHLFQQIKSYIDRFLVLPEDGNSSFLALWTMGTYVYRVFRHFPYVHINAEKGSGKSTLMEILEPIAFNGKHVIDTTGPAMFREVHRNGSTLFIDEAETLGGKSSVKSSLNAILNAGFAKGSTVARANEQFYIYSPKMVAGIQEINDVLASRSVKLKMLRRLEDEKVERYIDTRQIRDYQQSIRDNLYVFGLNHATEIYDRYSTDLSKEPAYAHLVNRAFDVWAPIFIIAEIVGKASDSDNVVMDEMIELSKRNIMERKRDDEASSEMVDLLNSFDEIETGVTPVKKEGDTMYYLTRDVYDYVRINKIVTAGTSKSMFTRSLHRVLDVDTKVLKHKGKPERVYIIDTKKISELKLRYGVQAA